MFASRVTETRTFGPFVVVIQKIGWRTQQKAADKHEEDLYAAMIRSGGDPFGRSRRAPRPADTPPSAPVAAAAPPEPATPPPVASPAPETKPAPLSPEQRRAMQQLRYGLYDQGIVLQAGIKSIRDGDEEPFKPSPAQLDDLDADVARELHEAILDLSLPPVDKTEEETDRKNGS